MQIDSVIEGAAERLASDAFLRIVKVAEMCQRDGTHF